VSATVLYALDAWYPAVRAGVHSLRVLGEEARADEQDIDAAWGALAPGDALAVVERAGSARSRLARLGRRDRLARISARLHGAARVDRWHVLPNTGGSHVLLPAARAGFAAGARLLPAGRRRSRALRSVLAHAGRAGLAGRLGLDELLVAAKGPLDPAGVPWLAARADLDVTVALGVPGLFRKAVVLASDGAGDVPGLVKLSLTPAARGQVRREAECLAHLGGSGRAPALLGHGDTGERAWLAQGCLAGRRSPDALGPLHFAFLAELFGRTARACALGELAFFGAASARLDALCGATGTDSTWIGAMAGLRDALHRGVAGGRLPCCRCHGDFTPWNLLVSDGRLMAFDWEFSLPCAPALHDLFHFHVQTGVLVRHVDAGRLLAELDALAAGPALATLRELGLEPADLDALAGLYVLHIATFDEETNRIQRPPFAQVDWLRRGRTELARLLRARLLAGAGRGAARKVRAA